jgi:hypothetical protein
MARDKKNFAIFILTHGRPDNVITLESLRKANYSGKTYFIIDNEDTQAQTYIDKFGANNVFMFDKKAIAKTFDDAYTGEDHRAIVYARNACFEIAKNLNLDYFLQLDDDYTAFLHRFVKGDKICSKQIANFDKIVDAMLDLLESTNALTVAMSQGGDHMGGVDGKIKNGLLRKAMNSFFCRTDTPVNFIGRVNDDVNAYVCYGQRGELFLTTMALQLNQVQTQQGSGGMSEFYKDSGTYTKSFYSVMMAPSCVSIGTMGRTDRRFHHSIKWDNAVPKIINEKYKRV